MTKASLFKNNQSQAVRIPKSVAFPDGVKAVEVRRVGNSLVLTPENSSWDSFFAGPATDGDFMTERAQPKMQVRDEF